MPDPDLMASWRFVLGDELVAFLLGASPGAPSAVDDQAAVGVLRWLSSNVERLEREDPRLPVALVRATADGLPLAWALRRQAGGDVPDPDTAASDAVERHLARIARDTFPLLLAPSGRMLTAGPGRALPAADPEIGLVQVADGHTSAAALSAALDAEGLTRVAGAFATAMTVSSLAEVSVDSLMSAAALRFRHVPERSAQAFMARAADVLEQLRAAAAGETAQVPALIGFVSLSLPPATELTLPQGRLRVAAPGERRYAPLSVLADSVLETTVTARRVEPGGDSGTTQADGQMLLNRLAREVCLATALGCPDVVPQSCPAVAWVTELSPIGGQGAFRPLHPAQPPPGRRAPMADHEIAGLERWAAKVAGADLSHVQIAVDRLLRALWEMEWTESLIDAVIAWESLLGTRLETSFRVTAALAKLCEHDVSRRLAVRKRLETIYNARSRLVHGDVPDGKLHEHRASAIDVALDALRRLIRDRPDLLALPKSSERADRLLLDI